MSELVCVCVCECVQEPYPFPSEIEAKTDPDITAFKPKARETRQPKRLACNVKTKAKFDSKWQKVGDGDGKWESRGVTSSIQEGKRLGRWRVST